MEIEYNAAKAVQLNLFFLFMKPVGRTLAYQSLQTRFSLLQGTAQNEGASVSGKGMFVQKS